MFYCGIDIAKYRHEAAVIDEAGAALLDSISFSNSKEGCEKLLALFQRLGISKDDLLIGMEATGHYWLSVYGYLLEQGFEVKVINPIQSEAFRKMYIRQTKNDRKDSFMIAQIMRFGQFLRNEPVRRGHRGDAAAEPVPGWRWWMPAGTASAGSSRCWIRCSQSTTRCSRTPSESPPRKSSPNTPPQRTCCLFPPENSPLF